MTVRSLCSTSPNTLLNIYIEPSIAGGDDEAFIQGVVILMEASADIVLTLAITPQRLKVFGNLGIRVFCLVGLSPIWYTNLTCAYVDVGKTAGGKLSPGTIHVAL
jgi:hypothetical protein